MLIDTCSEGRNVPVLRFAQLLVLLVGLKLVLRSTRAVEHDLVLYSGISADVIGDNWLLLPG